MNRARRLSGPRILGIVGLFLLYAFPIYWLVSASLATNTQLAGKAVLVVSPSLDAYERVLTPALGRASLNSFIIAVGTTALTIGLAVPAAYGLARVRGWSVSICLSVLIILQMMPQTSLIVPLYQILGTWRLVGTIPGLIVADTAQLLPLSILILRPFFRSVPREVEESAAIDGATRLRAFISVVLPLARNGVLTAATLVFLIAWGEFLFAITLLLDPSTYPISALLAQQHSNFGLDWPALMAIAVIGAIPILVVFLFTYRLLREGISMGVR